MTDAIVTLDFNLTTLLGECDPSGHLQTYFDLLRAENKKVNLVSRETIDTGLETLAAESLLPFQKIETSSFDTYLDIGSGGGFPAIPLILTKNIGSARLFERTTKKSLALERIIGGLGLDKHRFCVEQSDFGQLSLGQTVDLVTLRLVKLTSKVMRGVSAALGRGGHFVYYSDIPENISTSDFSHLTYCYRADNDSPEKRFTIFKKN